MSEREYIAKGEKHLKQIAKSTAGLIHYTLNWNEAMTKSEVDIFINELRNELKEFNYIS